MLGKPSKRLMKQLEENGKHANATVVEIAEKGMAVTRGAEGVIGNTELALKAHLRVQPDDEPEFEVKKRFSFPQLAVPSAGSDDPGALRPERPRQDHRRLLARGPAVGGVLRGGDRPEPDRPADGAGPADGRAGGARCMAAWARCREWSPA